MSDLDQTAKLWSAHLLNQGVSYDFSARDVKAMKLMEKFLKLSEHPNHHPKHKDSLDDFNGYVTKRWFSEQSDEFIDSPAEHPCLRHVNPFDTTIDHHFLGYIGPRGVG